jgi:hypothetical protein
MKIKSGKFIMVAITCILLGNLDPMRPYKNATIECDTMRQAADIQRYARRIGIELAPVEEEQPC